mmetsp:Transcript_28722/g.62926  ORF Transcript_28722/g.62926 Transcript_28722/m.62926 type:complete len:95 (-) Transcript_28722:56-340(-)
MFRPTVLFPTEDKLFDGVVHEKQARRPVKCGDSIGTAREVSSLPPAGAVDILPRKLDAQMDAMSAAYDLGKAEYFVNAAQSTKMRCVLAGVTFQ